MRPIARNRHSRMGPAAVAAAFLIAACGSPTAPSPAHQVSNALPVQTTTAHSVFSHVDGDRVDPERQEIYHDWVVTRLGLSLDRRIA